MILTGRAVADGDVGDITRTALLVTMATHRKGYWVNIFNTIQNIGCRIYVEDTGLVQQHSARDTRPIYLTPYET